MQTPPAGEPTLNEFYWVHFSAAGGGGGTASDFESPDDPQAVLAWYAARLTDHEEEQPGNWYRERSDEDGWVSIHRVVVQPRAAWTPDASGDVPKDPDSRTIVHEFSALHPPPATG